MARSTTFGVHTGPANTTVAELIDLWRRVEEGPYDWISIWDHFYAADGNNQTNLEAVTMHTALAMSTTRVRCGSLVYCAGYRHPAVLANAMAAIDHLSGGRVLFGIGGGWNLEEMENHGTKPSLRWKIMRERVLAMKEIWTRDEAEYHGQHEIGRAHV